MVTVIDGRNNKNHRRQLTDRPHIGLMDLIVFFFFFD